MALWIWVLSAGGALLAVLCVAYAYGLHRKRYDPAGDAFLHADAHAGASAVRLDPLRDMLTVADQAPSSVYRGQVCFFDSIEHRDMFEANHHRPVAIDSVLVAIQEQHGRRIQRQGAR